MTHDRSRRVDRRGLEAALVGRNLLAAKHVEFRSELVPLRTEIERSAFASLTWRR